MKATQDSRKYETGNPVKKMLVKEFLEDLYLDVKRIQPRSILDIGCGEGFVDLFFLQRQPKWKIKGIDISKKSLEIARKRVPKMKFQLADATSLPFREDSFDLTLCTEVLEHLNSPQKVISEARRVSRTNCIFSVPREPLFSLLSLLSGAHIKRLGRHPDHFNFWNKRSFSKLVQKYFSKPVEAKTSAAWIIVIGRK